MTDIFEKTRIEIRLLRGLLDSKMVNVSPNHFSFGLPINLNLNNEQNKFEVDILKNVAKKANLRPKIGQMPLLSLNINRHNSVIEWCQNQSSISFG